MSYQRQLDFFLEEEHRDVHMLKMELDELKESHNSVRKSLFAKNNELGKMIISQQMQIDKLREMVIR